MPIAFCSSAAATCNMAPSIATGQIHTDAWQVHVLLQMRACIQASCQTNLAGGVRWTPHVTSDGFAHAVVWEGKPFCEKSKPCMTGHSYTLLHIHVS